MNTFLTLLPLLVLVMIIGLIVARRLPALRALNGVRTRSAQTKLRPRARRRHLRAVDPATMDEELRQLLRKR